MKAFQNLRQKLGRKVGAMIGGFEGGLSARRLKTFAASRAHVNTLIQAAGADMTARARYLIRNNGYAANAVESWAGNAVGTGIKPSSGIADAVLKDRVQRLWLRWTDESDAEGLTDFYGQQRRAARELFIAGEVFFRIRPRRPEDGLSVPLQLQMLPAEMLPLNHNQLLENGHRIRQGIEFDRIGRRVAYHFLRRHAAAHGGLPGAHEAHEIEVGALAGHRGRSMANVSAGASARCIRRPFTRGRNGPRSPARASPRTPRRRAPR